MDYVYNYQIDTTLDEGGIKLIADTALKRARLKAPIKTGNLRRSIKYQINGDIVMLYIDTTMYDVPYYKYVNEAPKKWSSRSVTGIGIMLLQSSQCFVCEFRQAF